MRKYWKTIVISVVIVLTVGTFYFQVAQANKLDVAIQIETTSGNEDEIAHLQLQGYYYEDENIMGHSFLLTKDGVTDLSYPSFGETLMSPTRSPMMQNYVKEYRSFMRGKDISELKFFEDEDRIIYTDFQDYGQRTIQGNPLTLQIHILDKNSEEQSSFEVETKAEATYEWIHIDDVYVEDGKIKVFVKGYLLNYDSEEMRVFTVDEATKEVVQQTLSSKKEEGKTSNMRQLTNKQSLQNVEYSVYLERTFKTEKDHPYSQHGELVSEKWFIYNNRTDEVKEWIVPEELQEDTNGVVLYGSSLIVVVPTDIGIEINRYQIEQDEWETPVNWDIANFSGGEILSTRQMDEKLYVLNQSSNNHPMAIIDLTTDEVLYEGHMTVEKDGKKVSDYKLSIYELYETK